MKLHETLFAMRNILEHRIAVFFSFACSIINRRILLAFALYVEMDDLLSCVLVYVLVFFACTRNSVA